jgi:hypothetical protein
MIIAVAGPSFDGDAKAVTPVIVRLAPAVRGVSIPSLTSPMLAMTQTRLRDPAARFARGLLLVARSSERGRRESRVRAAPAVSRARLGKETHTSIQVQRKQSGLPCAMVLTVSSELSPVTGLSCHRRLADTSAKLDASVGASGPHGFAVRIRRSRQAHHPRPSHPAPRFVTLRNAPLCGTGWLRYRTDLRLRKIRIFLQTGLDKASRGKRSDLPVGPVGSALQPARSENRGDPAQIAGASQ